MTKSLHPGGGVKCTSEHRHSLTSSGCAWCVEPSTTYFNNREHDCLFSSVVIGHQAQISQLPSLLSWMRCHQAHVKLLDVHHDGPWQEMALTALLSPTACLEQVCFRSPVKDTVLVLLSTFKSVTTCKLFSHNNLSLDLRPLSALPLLTRLALEGGRFSGLEAAARLSSLVLQATEVVCAQECSCVTSLVELKLVFAKLYSFHSKNVAACLCLESLVLDSASIIGHTPVESLAFPDDEAPSIPSGMSAMTALTSLELHYPAHAMWFGWLTTLSALQSFTLTSSGCQEALFPASCSSLTSLKTMTICLKSKNLLVFMFDLGTLASLQRF